MVVATHHALVKSAGSPALFFCNAFGDHLLIRPTVLALQSIFEGRLGYIGLAGYARAFFPDAGFRFTHDVYFGDSVLTHGFRVDDVLSTNDTFDSIISLNYWDSEDVHRLARAIDPKPFFGVHAAHGQLAPSTSERHVMDQAFELAKFFDPTVRLGDYLSLPPLPSENVHRARYIRSLMPPDSKLLCVHTHTKDSKQWPRERFAEILNGFLASHPEFVAAVVDPMDSNLDVGPFESRIFSLEGVDLETTTALVAQSDLFLGIDSYFLHVADFSLVPAIGLFGPTDPARWGFRVTPHFRHIKAPAMSAIDVPQVAAALDDLVSAIDRRMLHDTCLP